VREKLGVDGVKTLEDTVKDGFQWLEAEETRGALEYEDKYKEVEGVCRPIMMKLYPASSKEESTEDSAEGSTEGNMPGMHGSEQGPKVEEVD
jgi:hypothetical protein